MKTAMEVRAEAERTVTIEELARIKVNEITEEMFYERRTNLNIYYDHKEEEVWERADRLLEEMGFHITNCMGYHCISCTIPTDSEQ